MSLKKKQLQQSQSQWESEMSLKKQQLAEDQRQFNAEYALAKAKQSSSSGVAQNTKNNTAVAANTKKDTGSSYNDAVTYFNKMIAAGASQNQILAEIVSAQKNGVLTQAEAKKLKEIFNPRGVQY